MDPSDHHSHLASQIAEAVINTYRKLPKRGKPQIPREWTLLAGVVMSIKDKSGIKLKTVSLGTGSKCIGKSKMSSNGGILNDSHAEVLARRSLLLFLYEELEKAYQATSEVFLPPDAEHENRCLLQPGVAFHFFTSHTPCGDASIFPKTSNRNHKKVCHLEVSHHKTENEHMDKTLQGGLESVYLPKSEGKHSVIQSNVTSGEANENNTVSSYHRCLTATTNLNSRPQGHSESSVSTESEVLPRRDGSTSLEILPPNSKSASCQIHPQNSITADNKIHVTASRKRKYADAGSDLLEDEYDDIGDACIKLGSHTEGVCSDFHGLLENADRSADDVYRTGAKCVPGGEQDTFAPASSYHVVGLLRTKPGRGERTESMSCSDKIAKWNVVGCQGALLSLFMAEPLYFASLVVGKCPYSAEAMRRAVISRVCPLSSSLSPPFKVNEPVLSQTIDQEFEASRDQAEDFHRANASKIVPSASAVIWFLSSKSDAVNHDVIVNGRRQGITKNDIHKPHARSSVCSASLFRCFYDLVEKVKPASGPSFLGIENIRTLTYWETKSLANEYQMAWGGLRKSVFRTWITKQRELLHFYVND